jgi:hypothetical protein
MSILSRLFGGGSTPGPEPTDHKGFAITPQPQREGNGWRIGALIEKDGRTHHLIRADMLNDREAADQASVGKAKQMIDEQGDRLFD